jgi:anti-sigma factor RsiW
MKARIFALDSDEHRKAQELLPWFVSRTLGATESAEVARHVEECGRCKADAAEIARIRALGELPAWHSPERGWSALLQRVQREPAASLSPRATALTHRRLQIAVVLQAVIILAFALALLWRAPLGEPYRALGASSSPATANAVVVFAADATQAQMADALRAGGAHIVGGPTTSGAFLLHIDKGPLLAELRQQRGVVSAASLDPDLGK